MNLKNYRLLISIKEIFIKNVIYIYIVDYIIMTLIFLLFFFFIIITFAL